MPEELSEGTGASWTHKSEGAILPYVQCGICAATVFHGEQSMRTHEAWHEQMSTDVKVDAKSSSLHHYDADGLKVGDRIEVMTPRGDWEFGGPATVIDIDLDRVEYKLDRDPHKLSECTWIIEFENGYSWRYLNEGVA